MAINPYDYVQKVYDAKVAYGNATTDAERLKQQQIADAARSKLEKYGYSDLAKQVSADGATAEAVKRLLNNYQKTDKVKTRDYLYDLGKSKGMSKAEMDAIIGWDNDTGQVSLGGKVIGTPDLEVDGVSYWSDTSKLDNAFNDYITRTGTTRSKETAVNQENENLFKKYNQEYEDLKNTDPFSTKEAKTILSKYDLAGLQGRNNALASNAGSNDGNIDSFAAANALRQQAALVNEGQMTVLSAHQQKLDHARNLLADMGVNIDRVFNQDETSKNNAASREIAINEATGYNTDNQLKTLSSMWNSDGSLVDVNTDYQNEINRVKGLYDKATNESDKQSYALALKLLEMARNDKIDLTGRTEGKTYLYQNLTENAASKLTKSQIEQAERALFAELNANKEMQEAELNANKEMQAAEIAHDINKLNLTNSYKLQTGGSGGSGGTKTTKTTSKTTGKTTLTESQVSSWVKYFEDFVADNYGGTVKAFKQTGKNQYERADLDADFIIQKVYGSDDLTVEQMNYLLGKLGISPDEINTALNDKHYR